MCVTSSDWVSRNLRNFVRDTWHKWRKSVFLTTWEFPPNFSTLMTSLCLYHCLQTRARVSQGVRHLPRWHVPRPQSLSSRHSSWVRSAEAGTQASYGEFSSLKPSGHLHVGKWFTETQTALVPHSPNPKHGSLHWLSRHSLSMGQSLLKWHPSSHSLMLCSGPWPQIWPKGQLESDRQPGRHTLSSQYSPARQCAS